MIRVYFLPVETIDGTEQVAGIEFMHDALLECTEDPQVRCLIQNTTQDEHDGLVAVALTWREPEAIELAQFNAREIEPPPSADTLRAQELLASSPDVITQPEQWELLRIFGRRLGYDF